MLQSAEIKDIFMLWVKHNFNNINIILVFRKVTGDKSKEDSFVHLLMQHELSLKKWNTNWTAVITSWLLKVCSRCPVFRLLWVQIYLFWTKGTKDEDFLFWWAWWWVAGSRRPAVLLSLGLQTSRNLTKSFTS